VPRFAFLDAPTPIASAHRGGAAEAPENSVAAFAHAVSLGYRYLETDVHVTADGVLVAFHDTTLDRVTDGSGRIRDLPWAQVRKARIEGREPIPTMAELLDTFPDTRWSIDAKTEAAVEPLVATIRSARAQDRVCLGAFSDQRVRRLRAALPEVCTALGPREVAALVASLGRRSAGDAPPLPAGAAVVPVGSWPLRLVTPRFVGKAHAAGLAVHVWTVNDRRWMARLVDLGVDGLMTDHLQMLKDVLVERDRWHPPT
jgi:glycerophosphoryl diester phosphodiesterase